MCSSDLKNSVFEVAVDNKSSKISAISPLTIVVSGNALFLMKSLLLSLEKMFIYLRPDTFVIEALNGNRNHSPDKAQSRLFRAST